MAESDPKIPNNPGTVEPAPLVYSITDARKMLGNISRNTVYRLFETEQLRPIKIGGRTMVAHSDLVNLIAASRAA